MVDGHFKCKYCDCSINIVHGHEKNKKMFFREVRKKQVLKDEQVHMVYTED